MAARVPARLPAETVCNAASVFSAKGLVAMPRPPLPRPIVLLMAVSVVGFGLFQGARLLDLGTGPYTSAPYGVVDIAAGGIAYLVVALIAYAGRLESALPLFPAGVACALASMALAALSHADPALCASQVLSGVGWALVNLCWMQLFSYSIPAYSGLLIALGYVVDASLVPLVQTFIPNLRGWCYAIALGLSWGALAVCLRGAIPLARAMGNPETPSSWENLAPRLTRAVIGVSIFAWLCGYIVQDDITNGVAYAQNPLASLLCLGVSVGISVVWIARKPQGFSIDTVYPVLVAAFASILLARSIVPNVSPTSAGSFMVALLVTFFALLWMAFTAEAHARQLPALFLLGLPVSAAQLSIAAGRLSARAVEGAHVALPESHLAMIALWVLVLLMCVLYLTAVGRRHTATPAPEDACEESSATTAGPSDPALALLQETYGLSQREAQVVAAYSSGRSARYIADLLVISEHTVKTHLRRAYVKLDVHSRQELLDMLLNLERPDAAEKPASGRPGTRS